MMTTLTNLIILLATGLLAIGAAIGLLLVWQMWKLWLRPGGRHHLRLPSLSAYVTDVSWEHGQDALVCVHCVSQAKATLFRAGREWEQIPWEALVNTTSQPTLFRRWRGCEWQVNLRIPTSNLRPGMFVLKLELVDHPEVFYRVAWLLKSTEPAEVSVIASTNTWNAYNHFGGLSVYADFITPYPLRLFSKFLQVINVRLTVGDRRHLPNVPLPFARPNDAVHLELLDPLEPPQQRPSHLARAELGLYGFLEREGFSYSVYSDADFAFDPRPTRAKLLLFHVHSEYWSPEMVGKLRAYVTAGGRVGFLSGNNIYRLVQYYEHGIEVYDFRSDFEETVRQLGAAYNAYGYLTYAGYRAMAADHWLYEGLDVRDGQVFAGRSKQDNPSPLSPAAGASGYETDKVSGSVENTTIVAVGENPEGPAFAVVKDFPPSGGWIVNFGSVAFAPWINTDPIAAGMVRNLLRRGVS